MTRPAGLSETKISLTLPQISRLSLNPLFNHSWSKAVSLGPQAF